VQIAIADLLRWRCSPGWWWSHIPSGEYRAKATGGRLKRMGLKPGIFDLLLIDPFGVHYWLELKRARQGRTSADQKAFRQHLELAGVPHAICAGFDAAVAQLLAWGAILPTRI
jgi:hypothetical protein